MRIPQVRWRRSRITVEPDEGWKPNRVYRVELLPGVTDLRHNRSKETKVLTASTTGAPLPDRTLQGLVVDWTTNRPAALALVDALHVADSLPDRTLTDSSGRFSLGPLPSGDYLVKGVIDENHDFRPGEREAFDSLRVGTKSATTKVGELWTFVHDTARRADPQPRRRRQRVGHGRVQPVARPSPAPRRIGGIAPAAARLHAGQDRFCSSQACRRQPQSPHGAPRHYRTRYHRTRHDSPETRPSGSGRVSARFRPLVAREEAEKPLTNLLLLFNQLVVRVPAPWKPEAKYVLEIRGVRSVSGVSGDVSGVLTIPKREATDSLRTGKDSLRARKDSLRTGKDSLAKPLKKRS